ncbi:MAG: phosphonate C-P lyase system protein PhnH [Rhodopila sp.]|nr:phosphonate C-P lyase system protein PhnH [Rhodopila sp.]
MTSTLSPGFADPVTDAQSCFRAVLDAMARPGRVHTVRGVSAPMPLCEAAGAVLLTLADHETPLRLDPDAAPARAWIAFHTGAPIETDAPAMFAMALSLPDLDTLPNGTDEMPETSATVILQVASLTAGQRFVLEGPGLREPKVLTVAGLPPDFVAIWQRNHALFPRGIDLILCARNKLTALPRSVSIKEA